MKEGLHRYNLKIYNREAYYTHVYFLVWLFNIMIYLLWFGHVSRMHTCSLLAGPPPLAVTLYLSYQLLACQDPLYGRKNVESKLWLSTGSCVWVPLSQVNLEMPNVVFKRRRQNSLAATPYIQHPAAASHSQTYKGEAIHRC